MSRLCLAALAGVLALSAGPRLAVADPDLAGDPVTDAELAAARAAKVSCKSLDRASNESPFRTETARAIAVKACKRDRWKLAVIVCLLRDRGDACEERLPKRALARYRKALDKASGTIAQEERLWAIEQARAAGILGTGSVGPYASLTAGDPSTTGAPAGAGWNERPAPPPPDPEIVAAKAAIDAWAQKAYEQCTDQTRNLTITVSIVANKCHDVRIAGVRRSDEMSRCVKALCTSTEWAGTPDITRDAHGRPPASP